MTIPSITNTQTAGVQNSISRTLESSSDVAKKLSSGQGIISPYEDPAGLAIGTKLGVDLAIFKEALKGANQAAVVLNIAYGGAKNITSILKRLSELSIMALNGSAGDEDRKLTNLEAQQLIKEIGRIAESTNFNGRGLINGSTAKTTVKTTEYPLPIKETEGGYEFKFAEKNIQSRNGDLTINYNNDKFSINLVNNKKYEVDVQDVKIKAADIVTAKDGQGRIGDFTTLTIEGGTDITLDSNGIITYNSQTYDIYNGNDNNIGTIKLNDGNELTFSGQSMIIKNDNGDTEIEIKCGKTWGGTYYLALEDKLSGGDYKVESLTVKTNPKSLFKFTGTQGDVTEIKDVATGEPVLFSLESTGAVKDKNDKEIYNYKTKLSALEFGFSLYNNAITDEDGNQLIIYDEQSRKFHLNLDMEEKFILGINGKKAYKYDTAAKAVTSLDGAKTYFKVDDPNNVNKVEGFKISDGKGGVKDGSLRLDSSKAKVEDQNSEQVFTFDLSKQKVTPMIFQVGTEDTDKIEISLDGVDSKKLEIDTLQLTDYEEAEEARVAVDAALSIMFHYNATIGSYQSRFRTVAESVSTSIENIDAARAQFMDADFTELTKEFSQDQARLTASLAAQAKLIQTPQSLLVLLQGM